MNTADDLQLRHQLGPALEARLLIVNGQGDCEPTWRDFQQAGVLYSELAEAHCQVCHEHSAGWQQNLLRQAQALFEQADTAVKNDQTLDPYRKNDAHAAIACDRAVAYARLARSVQDSPSMVRAVGIFEGYKGDTQGVLALCEKQATQDPAFGHTLGIAYALRFRLACGTRFGFLQLPENPVAARYAKQAEQYLNVQPSPDKQNAYRSLMMYRALYAHKLGAWDCVWRDAGKALISAIKHKDARHAMRAVLIGLFGSTGNRVYYALGLLRDRLGS